MTPKIKFPLLNRDDIPPIDYDDISAFVEKRSDYSVGEFERIYNLLIWARDNANPSS